jgi:CheY-like chemotaxis protein
MKTGKERYSILMADDSEDDRFFIRTALCDHPRLGVVAEVSSGEETIEYLSGTGIYHNRQEYPFPDLLLLDLKMPGFSGYDVLGWLQKQSFPFLKVVVLSGALLDDDRTQSLELGADAYHTKAASQAEQQHILRGLEVLLDASPSPRST